MLESLVQPLLANHEVIDQSIVSCHGLIWAAPPSVHEIEPTILDESLDLVLDLSSLILVPSLEELGLSVREGPGLVFHKLLVDRVEDIFHTANVLGVG